MQITTIFIRKLNSPINNSYYLSCLIQPQPADTRIIDAITGSLRYYGGGLELTCLIIVAIVVSSLEIRPGPIIICGLSLPGLSINRMLSAFWRHVYSVIYQLNTNHQKHILYTLYACLFRYKSSSPRDRLFRPAPSFRCSVCPPACTEERRRRRLNNSIPNNYLCNCWGRD